MQVQMQVWVQVWVQVHPNHSLALYRLLPHSLQSPMMPSSTLLRGAHSSLLPQLASSQTTGEVSATWSWRAMMLPGASRRAAASASSAALASAAA